MAVLTMKKIHICAMKKDRKMILELLQSLGAVEVRTDGEENEVFKKINTTSQRTKYEKRVQSADSALEILQQYAPEKVSMFAGLEGKKDVDDSKLDELISNRYRYNQVIKEIHDLDKKIGSCNLAISKCQLAIDGLIPWKNLDITLNTVGTKRTDVIMGSMGPELTESMIEAKIAEKKPELTGYHIQVISSDQDQTCVVAVSLKSCTQELEEAMRAEGFTRISYFSKRTPEGKIKKYQEEIKEHRDTIEKIRQRLGELAAERENIRLLSDYYRIRSDKYEVLGGLLQSKSTFLIDGYILAQEEEKVVSELEKRFTLMVCTEDVPEDETAPVKLKNNKMLASAEGVLESYGLPAKGEIDPTGPMCIFYIILFGIMLSDAAYGLIVFLACFIVLKKFPKMGESMAKSLRLFMYCGLSTLFWGVLFGGYFGDLISVVSRTFFHHEVTIKALWFEPLKDPMRMLIYSLLFGLIHLYGGLAMKGYMCLKKKDFVGFFADVIAWYMMITGLVMMIIPTELFASISQMSIKFSPAVKNLSYILAALGAVIIVLMSGRNNKNPALRIALGLYDIYGLTGWLSDLLSYSRLLALGLATGVIAQVINQMGSMIGDGIVGMIGFLLVFVIGHTFNLAINMLGAYVHTSRLQYVEFFGKFYEGGGTAFAPFKENTKYVEIKED